MHADHQFLSDLIEDQTDVTSFGSPDRLYPITLTDEALPPCEVTLIDRGEYRIRLANSHGQRSRASMLIQRMYGWRGYATACPPLRCEARANRVTMEASARDHLFGTITVNIDSAAGLAADELYFEELAGLRASGRRLCEFTQLAVDPSYGSKELLAALFQLGFIYGHKIFGANDCIIEVNPRHVGFYRRMLGFEEAGPRRQCPRVDAPAVLMKLDFAHCDRQIRKWAGKPALAAAERSLYTFSLSQEEQDGLSRRLGTCMQCRGRIGLAMGKDCPLRQH